jgi:hypothetical protein
VFGQSVSNVMRVGILAVARASPSTAPAWQAFTEELATHGFHVGKNVVLDTRWVDDDPRGPMSVAAELVKANVAMLAVEGPEIREL